MFARDQRRDDGADRDDARGRSPWLERLELRRAPRGSAAPALRMRASAASSSPGSTAGGRLARRRRRRRPAARRLRCLRFPLGALAVAAAHARAPRRSRRRSAAAAARVGGLGDRADDDEPRGAGAGHGRNGGAVDPADGKPGQRRVRRPRSGRSPARRPGGRASSASRGRVRRRGSRRAVAVAAASELGRAVGREADHGARPGELARAAATAMSSWPTWTPSARSAATRSGRSLRMKSAPAFVHNVARHGGGFEQLVVACVLRRGAGRHRRRRRARPQDVGERAAAGRAPATRYSRACASPDRGAWRQVWQARASRESRYAGASIRELREPAG